MSEDRAVRWEREGHVAHVWLSSPATRNAMGPTFWAQLPQVMAEVSADEQVRAVALCAEGPAYTVGLDLKTMGGMLIQEGGQVPFRERLLGEIRRLQAAINCVADFPLPVVTALQGYCLGGGVDLASACDVRVASADLVLSVREVRMAIVADLGSLQRLPHIIGRNHVAELAYTGRDVGAERCLQMGLVSQVLPDADTARQAAQQLAAQVAENSPVVLRGIKQTLRYGESHSVEDGLDQVAHYNAAFLPSDDLAEAFTAFMERRDPRFQGR
ncbi:MAG: crotonase/enoyl-CoA hydratase family protein [Myxococcota bacterium]|nr:crotonase/enoyl-CoA hydratase family protein [Myxococcota bacterium]